MTLLVSSRHPLAHRIVVLMIGVIIMAGIPSVAAPQYTFDASAFDESIRKIPSSDNDSNAAPKARQQLRDADRRAKTGEFVSLLEADRQQWQERKAEFDGKLQKLNQELKDSIALAQRDAKIRAWAKAVRLIGMAAVLVAEMASAPPAEATTQAPRETPPPKDGLHLQEQYQRAIILCDGGVCETIDMRQYINEVVQPMGRLDDAAVQKFRNKLHQAVSKLPSVRLDSGGDLGDSVRMTVLEGPSLLPARVSGVGTMPAPSALHSEQKVVEASLGRLGVTAAQWIAKHLKHATKVVKNNRGGGRPPQKPFGDKETVDEILSKTKKHKAFERLDWPKGSPSPAEFREMPWKQIEDGATNKKPGFSTVKKLLQGGKYDPAQNRRQNGRYQNRR